MTRSVVGINLLWLVPGEVGGSEHATVAALRALRAIDPDDLDLRLYVLEPFAAAHPGIVTGFATAVLPLSGRSRPLRVASEASWLAARTRGLDLVHHPGGTVPLVRTAPCVLTVHDVQPLEQTATHTRLKRWYLARTLPRSARVARAVAVPSEFVRASVISLLGVDPARVVVVPHGVDAPAAPLARDDDVRRRHDLNGPVVLYPAITYPHKNHVVLLQAFATVIERHPDAVLVLTGGSGPAEEQVRGEIARLGLTGHVRRLGRVPQADLDGLYQVASVVAVPSRYEGFGLPAIEAMVAGVPLVAAAATALPEVVAAAGVLVDPDDPGRWAAAIVRLLDDPRERERLVAAGRRRARAFTSEASAQALVGLYRRALSTGG